MSVMKIGNIVPRAGIEPAFLGFWASVLPLHHVGFLMSPLYTDSHLSMQLLASEVRADCCIYNLVKGIAFENVVDSLNYASFKLSMPVIESYYFGFS